jgi:hypothetical protein
MLQRFLGRDGPLKKLGFGGACNPDEADCSCVVARDGEFVRDKTIISDKDDGVKVITSPGGTRGVLVQPDALQPKPGFGQQKFRFQVERGAAVDAHSLSGLHSVDLWTKAHYQGQFLDGKFHGRGVYQFSDGRTYEGQFDRGNISGQGKFTWPIKSAQSRPTSPTATNGVSSPQPLSPENHVEFAVFEGVFLDNEPVEGTLTLPDDSGFTGPVKDVNGGKHQGLIQPPHYSPRHSVATMKGRDTRRTTAPRPSMLEFFANGMSFSAPPPIPSEPAKKRPSLRI